MAWGLARHPPSGDHHNRSDSVRVHLALQGLSALLLGLAFPRPGWGGLAYVALVPAAWIAVQTHRPWRLIWTSYLAASIWWLVMIGWLIPVTGGGYSALALYMALYTTASLLLVRWVHDRIHSSAVLVLPMVWVSFEIIRSQFLQGGFGWFALAHSQAPYEPSQGVSRIIQIADLFGQHSVSFLVAMTNGVIVDLLTPPRRRPHTVAPQAPRRPMRQRLASVVLWVVAFGGAWLYGEFRIRQTAHLPQQVIRVAVVQTNWPVSNTQSDDDKRLLDRWEQLGRLTLEAAAPRGGLAPSLVIWPESAVPSALNPEATSRTRDTAGYDQQLRDLSRVINAYLLVGAHAYDDWRPVTIDGQQYQEPAARFNSAYLYRPDASQFPERYDKMHRVPFGEYVPWVQDWPWMKDLFIKYLTPYTFDFTIGRGREAVVFPIAGLFPDSSDGRALRIAAPICFEDSTPEVCLAMAYERDGEKRADLLCNLTNDGWYPGYDQGVQHLQIAVLRCIENRVPMARSVNTGVSGFISSLGEVGPLVEKGGKRQLVEGYALHDVLLDPRATFFGRFGHAPMWCLAALTGLLAIAGFLRQSPSRTHARG
ncbi:MAG: apolipoprotein N-acyltransferase [Planctomycetes bacterium]|nr:apolipoprotein N-acyltransferase [Planctomycetota bacterium]